MVEFIQSEVRLACITPVRSPTPQQTNQAWIEQFVQSKAKAAKTLRQYRYQLQWFAQWLSYRPLVEVGSSDIEQYRNQLTERGLAAETVGQAIVAIRAWFEWAKGQGLIEINSAKFNGVQRRTAIVPSLLCWNMDCGQVRCVG